MSEFDLDCRPGSTSIGLTSEDKYFTVQLSLILWTLEEHKMMETCEILGRKGVRVGIAKPRFKGWPMTCFVESWNAVCDTVIVPGMCTIFLPVRSGSQYCDCNINSLWNTYIHTYIYIYVWHINAVVAELGINIRIKEDASILCDSEFCAKLRVTENQCVLFNPYLSLSLSLSLSLCIYIYIYIYI